MSLDQETRPKKRRRALQDAPPQLSTVQHHSEFWFDDGSVVLVARNTGFRVYRALLATQSTVFSDMFSSSSPDADAIIEGCPVVHLSDSPRDVAHFLRVLLPKAQPTLFARKYSFSFPQISAIIRLAHKYHVQPVLDQAISALEEAFPSHFEAWERIGTQTPAVKFKSEHAIAVVNLAFLVDRPSLLSVAFYRCALLGGAVLDGCKLGNGKTGTVVHLDRENAKRAIDGRNELAARALDVLLDIFDVDPCIECETPEGCGPVLQSMQQWAFGDTKSSEADILESWRERIELWVRDTDICDHCREALVERDVRARRRVWRELPKIFDIEEAVGPNCVSESSSDFSYEDSDG
ncbi:hypothetical protein GSI_12232 [Ganoderma sinense ZZ0214-1]|uniref:BTB domain-containing protein n=1 Tax=Ganoderma sinense ZZ0214-1 TaxID=1077348 RepID=A0A2G8RYA9_9APHY|nr:hypothetical protein GSI_12232 [Ganoderma sinense ZZ0214-1]